MRTAWVLVLVGGMALGCASVPHRADDALAEAAATEFGDASYACTDTVAVAKEAGIDYRRTVHGCLARDPASMHVLMAITVRAPLDAASAQGHAAVLGIVLRRTGDAFFAACLAKEPDDVQQEVRQALLYDGGLDVGREAEVVLQLKQRFPQTFPASFALRE